MGRWSYSNRGIIEEIPNFTIADLKAWGFLKEGYKTGTITLSKHGIELGSVRISVNIKKAEKENSYIQFNYNLNDESVSYIHEIELFPCYFGSYRLYFECKDCGKRVSALFFKNGYYSCRHCLRLVYLVSRRHRNPFLKQDQGNYLIQKAERLKKQGHPRKANRLYLKAEHMKNQGLIEAYMAYFTP